LVFFGLGALLMGDLIIRSTFLPRIFGVLGICGGLDWLTFLYRPLGYRLFHYVAGQERKLWLLMFGVNEQRWKKQASMGRTF
jgi:hypothetical protein